jgi:hypothetical protein
MLLQTAAGAKPENEMKNDCNATRATRVYDTAWRPWKDFLNIDRDDKSLHTVNRVLSDRSTNYTGAPLAGAYRLRKWYAVALH